MELTVFTELHQYIQNQVVSDIESQEELALPQNIDIIIIVIIFTILKSIWMRGISSSYNFQVNYWPNIRDIAWRFINNFSKNTILCNNTKLKM